MARKGVNLTGDTGADSERLVGGNRRRVGTAYPSYEVGLGRSIDDDDRLY